LASIFLQILDPNQKIVAYRKACKQYNVSDPITSLDKDGVVSLFLGGASSSVAAAAASPPPTEAAPTTTEGSSAPPDDDGGAEPAPSDPPPGEKSTGEASSSDRKRDHKASSSRSHQKDRKRSSSSKDHRGRSSEDKGAQKKKKTKEVTNEELFSNLNEVVGKRIVADSDEKKAEIAKALSADGFEFNQDVLEQYRESAQQIFENEIPVGDSASILRAANPRKDLSRVLEIYNETVNPRKSSAPKGRGTVPGSQGKPAHKRPYLVGKTPVIVVPKGMAAPITLINAHEFFANGHFVPREVAMKQGRAKRAGNQKITFTRQFRSSTGNNSVEYEIIDNPKKLGTNMKEWDRIVAVVALGQSWQFKDWYMEWSNPVQLFTRTFGFYVSMEGDRVPAEVGTWAVKQSKLNRDKRGLDTITFASFWNGLDEWMTVHRRELLPQPQDH